MIRECILKMFCLLSGSSPGDEEGSGSFAEETVENSLPQWMWTSNVAIYSHKGLATLEGPSRPLWGWSEQEEAELQVPSSLQFSMSPPSSLVPIAVLSNPLSSSFVHFGDREVDVIWIILIARL